MTTTNQWHPSGGTNVGAVVDMKISVSAKSAVVSTANMQPMFVDPMVHLRRECNRQNVYSENAINALKQWEFSQAKNGQDVDVSVNLREINFSLRK
jgi:hypothetical protein